MGFRTWTSGTANAFFNPASNTRLVWVVRAASGGTMAAASGGNGGAGGGECRVYDVTGLSGGEQYGIDIGSGGTAGGDGGDSVLKDGFSTPLCTAKGGKGVVMSGTGGLGGTGGSGGVGANGGTGGTSSNGGSDGGGGGGGAAGIVNMVPVAGQNGSNNSGATGGAGATGNNDLIAGHGSNGGNNGADGQAGAVYGGGAGGPGANGIGADGATGRVDVYWGDDITLLVGGSSTTPNVMTNFGGFELGLIETSETITGTANIQTSHVRTGTYSLRCNPTTTATGSLRAVGYSESTGVSGFLSIANSYHRFWIYIATLPGSNSEEICAVVDTAGTTKLVIRINSAGNLMAFQTNGTTQIGSTGTTVLATGTYYRINLYCETGASAAWSVAINGLGEMSGTTDAVGTSNCGGLTLGKKTDRNSQTVDFYYDDYAISSSGPPANNAGCLAMTVDSNGNYQQFSIGAGSGSAFQVVDEIPPNSTDYIVSDLTTGHASTFGFVSCMTAGISGLINSAKSLAYHTRNDGTNGAFLHRFRAGTTDSDGASAASTSIYRTNCFIWNTNPATSANWTTGGLDGAEVGYVENTGTTHATRVSAAVLMVDFDPNIVVATSVVPQIASHMNRMRA